mmetsp:Transcript_29214/g.67973  ORF Transcript_29214/g.67973 Transcript_29214/m.67973 type:complete len:224 (+) Transcript_29214:1314-1985(+)
MHPRHSALRRHQLERPLQALGLHPCMPFWHSPTPPPLLFCRRLLALCLAQLHSGQTTQPTKASSSDPPQAGQCEPAVPFLLHPLPLANSHPLHQRPTRPCNKPSPGQLVTERLVQACQPGIWSWSPPELRRHSGPELAPFLVSLTVRRRAASAQRSSSFSLWLPLHWGCICRCSHFFPNSSRGCRKVPSRVPPLDVTSAQTLAVPAPKASSYESPPSHPRQEI